MLRTFGAIAGMVLLTTAAGNTIAADNPQAAPKPGESSRAAPAAAAVASAGSPAALALADAIRGGWVADIEGVRHIFILKVLDGVVSGVYCDVDCSEPSHLSLVERGTLTSDGVLFQIHRLDGKAPERTDGVGRISGGQLVLTLGARDSARAEQQIAGASTGARQWTLHRDPRKPALVTVEEMFARRGITSGSLVISGSPNPYTPPGPNEALSPAAVEGLWVYSTGPAKQNFSFRRVGEQIMGVVCGPCDNPYTFGVIDNVAIRGETMTFDINHTDAGIGIEYGPFANHVTTTVSHHEMHLHSVQHAGSRTIEGDLVLIGPLRQTTR
ncbi:MAG: hypothetical protein WDO68_31225 [Gammaproteobacteria bacterium]